MLEDNGIIEDVDDAAIQMLAYLKSKSHSYQLRAAFGKMQGAFWDIPYRIAAKVCENWTMEVRIWTVETCNLVFRRLIKMRNSSFFCSKTALIFA